MALCKMKKAVQGKKSNENTTMTKNIVNYCDKIKSVSSTSNKKTRKIYNYHQFFSSNLKRKNKQNWIFKTFKWAKLKTAKFEISFKKFHWCWDKTTLAWILKLYSTGRNESYKSGKFTKENYMKIKKSYRNIIY